ncbi:MAG: hypothetical protein GEV28_37740 [Actinophytocola sp.]|uniref:DUF5685 family protein n=1 Tax=Actinophytocola sp. TaxID=1872138 RepID=UPI00132595EE|nr:DUF5685 family protein [Actinophytocola sp.]MPZ85819.1 hypothetical protein [Actinophytocola sp.]
MFGIIRPCRHRLSERLRTAWLAHLCGLCLTLRDEHGQLARAATNYDGLIVSALVDAQSAGDRRRSAGPCPLRGMRTAEVSVGDGARLAAAASLVLAAAKVRDHVDDGDGAFARRPVAGAARVVAGRWARQGAATGTGIGFDTAVLFDAVGRQSAVEAAAGRGEVLTVTEPTETATAAACAHTAVLAGRPANVAPLREVGRLFGRVVHLVDAVEDLDDDLAAGAWNPLTGTGTSLAEARRLCDDAVLGVRLALRECAFRDGALVHALLVHELEQAVIRAFAHRSRRGVDDGAGGGCWVPRFRVPPRPRDAVLGCGVALYQCCSCQFCCRDPFPGPWSGRPRESCGDCDCCPDCGGGKGGGCDCDCCGCDCC